MNDPTKPYELLFNERAGYLRAKVSAETIDRPTAIAYLTQVAERSRATAFTRVMLIRDIPVMLADSDLFFTTTDFLKMIGDTKVAFVNPYLTIELEMDFAILIGKNRGGDLQLFNNEISAEEWLLGD